MELRVLPAQVAELTSQIVQLREEMHDEFSAIRDEFRTADGRVVKTLREDIRASKDQVVTTLREDIRASNEQVVTMLRDEIRAGDEETRTILRDEIRAGDNETRTFMRVLHEDVIGRIGMLQEQLASRPERKATTPARKRARKRR